MASCRCQAASAFGRQHRAEPGGVQVGDQAVVAGPGGVHDAAEPVDRADQVLDGVGAGHVAGLDPDLGPGGPQLGGQVIGPGRGRAPAAGQHQPADAVRLDQVPGHQRAQPAGAAGDEHRVVRAEHRRGRLRRDPAESREQHLPVPDGGLRLPGRGDRREQGGVDRAVGVDQQEAAGVLGLGRADQAPDRHLVQRDVLVGVHGHGLPGEQHQRHLLRPGQPGLQGGQHRGHRAAHGLRHVTVTGRDGVHLDGLGRGRQRRLAPDDLEQRRGARPGQLLGRGGPQHQPGHLGDRQPGPVGGVHLDAVPVAAQPDPQAGGGGAVQGDAAPGERERGQAVLPVRHQVGQQHGVQGRVEQGRVQPEPLGLGVRRLRQGHLGEHLAAADPGRPHAAEGRAVVQADPGQVGVEPVHCDRLGAGRRPGREVPGGSLARGGQGAARVQRPGRLAVAVRAGVDGEGLGA